MLDIYRISDLTYKPGNEESQVWQDLFSAYQNKMVIKGLVTGLEEVNGRESGYYLVVDFASVRGIVLQSETGLKDIPETTGGMSNKEQAALRKRLSKLVGQEEPFRIVKILREENTVILSRKLAMEQLAKITWEKIDKGKELVAKIQAVSIDRIVLNVGGITVNMPVKELTWGHPGDPRGRYYAGQELPVKVFSVDREKEKLEVSHRACLADPWPGCGEKYKVGNIYRGVVTGIIDRAVFVNIEPGVDVYCRHMKHERPEIGEVVVCSIHGVDVNKRRFWGKVQGRKGRVGR